MLVTVKGNFLPSLYLVVLSVSYTGAYAAAFADSHAVAHAFALA
jgi:hypothetical protein